MAWLPVAAALLGTGWGSNQITPMLLVYRHTLELGTGTLEAMFGVEGALPAEPRSRLYASASMVRQHTPATDETQSTAPSPSSRLLSGEEQVCPHSTYVCKLASQTF